MAQMPSSAALNFRTIDDSIDRLTSFAGATESDRLRAIIRIISYCENSRNETYCCRSEGHSDVAILSRTEWRNTVIRLGVAPARRNACDAQCRGLVVDQIKLEGCSGANGDLVKIV